MIEINKINKNIKKEVFKIDFIECIYYALFIPLFIFLIIGYIEKHKPLIIISFFIVIAIINLYLLINKYKKNLINKHKEDVIKYKKEIFILFKNKKNEKSREICYYLNSLDNENDLNDLKLDIHMLEKIFKKLNKSLKKEKEKELNPI